MWTSGLSKVFPAAAMAAAWVAVSLIATLSIQTSPAQANSQAESFLELGPVFMRREAPDAAPIFSSVGNPASGDIFNAADIDPGWEPGVMGRIGLGALGAWAVELGGFWIAPHKDSRSANFAGNFVINSSPTTLFVGGVTETLDWRSEIAGGEFNTTHDVIPGLELLGGVRLIALNERLKAAELTAAESYMWKTRNLLIGPQIGARLDLNQMSGAEMGPFSLSLEGKAAILHNDTHTFFEQQIGFPVNQARDNDSNLAVLLQGAIDAGVQVAEGVRLSLAYQVMWIDGVAQATEQVGQTQIFAPAIGTTTNDVLYHGGRVTLTVDLP